RRHPHAPEPDLAAAGRADRAGAELGLRAAHEGGRGRLMTIGKIIVLAVIIAMGCAALVFSWPHRAVGLESHCDNLDSLVEIGEAYADFEIFGAVGYEGALTDTTVIYRAAGHICGLMYQAHQRLGGRE